MTHPRPGPRQDRSGAAAGAVDLPRGFQRLRNVITLELVEPGQEGGRIDVRAVWSGFPGTHRGGDSGHAQQVEEGEEGPALGNALQAAQDRGERVRCDRSSGWIEGGLSVGSEGFGQGAKRFWWQLVAGRP